MSSEIKVTSLKFKGKGDKKKNQEKPANTSDHLAQALENTNSKAPEEPGKTLAEKSYEMVKKKRLIHKAHEKAKESNK